MTPWLLSISLAYLLGSIPFGYLLVRIFRNEDIRALGSGNIGATNVARSGAKGLGIATLLLDLGKGLAGVLIAFQIAAHFATWRAEPASVARAHAFDLAVVAAMAAVIGHIAPVWLRFRGGKGVATALGVFIVLVPLASLCVAGVFALVFLLTRYVSLASVLAAASFPLFGFYFVRHPSPLTVLGFLLIPALVCLKHQANIRRLLAGTESRFKADPRKAAA